MNILLSLVDNNEPFCKDKQGEYHFGNILNILSSGIICSKEKLTYKIDRLFLLVSKQQKSILKRCKEAVTCLNQFCLEKKVKFLHDENDLMIYDENETENLKSSYLLILNIIKKIHVQQPDAKIFINLTSGNEKMRLGLCLVTYNLILNKTSYLLPIHNYEKNEDIKNCDSGQCNVDYIDFQTLISEDSSIVLAQYIDSYVYMLASSSLNSEKYIVNSEFEELLSFVCILLRQINFTSAISQIKNKNLLNKVKQIALIEKVSSIINVNQDTTFTNLSNLISYLLVLNRYLLLENYQKFSALISSAFFEIAIDIMENEKSLFSKPRKGYQTIDYADYLIVKYPNRAFSKLCLNEEKLKSLSKFNNLNGNKDSKLELNIKNYATLTGVNELRKNINFRNNYPINNVVITKNNDFLNKFIEYENTFRNNAKHSSYIKKSDYHKLKYSSYDIFELILECINLNKGIELTKVEFDDFFIQINRLLKEEL